MREKPFTPSSRSSRGSASVVIRDSRGLTLLELLVAMTVTGILTSATLMIALSSRGMFETDQHRTTINQNLRAGLDMIGIDIRQAGERMPFDAPAVEIRDGAAGAADTLYLRRNMLDYVMPLCKDIAGGSAADATFIARKKGAMSSGRIPQGCAPVPDENGDGWPDNLEAWRSYRLSQGGSAWVYIYNPVTRNGEFFLYDDEDVSTFHLHKANVDLWVYDYPVVQDCRMYMLEQRHFRLEDDVLQIVINEDTANALNLVNHISDFQVDAVFQDGTVAPSLSSGDEWTDLRSVQVRLVARSEFGGRTMEREVVSRFFPRNILSN